jgi:XapX domain-containing protein
MKFAIGIVLSFAVGVCCRVFDIPVPSPPFLPGAILVLVMTLGYSTASAVLNGRKKPATTTHLCGGPTGTTSSAEMLSATYVIEAPVDLRCRDPESGR